MTADTKKSFISYRLGERASIAQVQSLFVIILAALCFAGGLKTTATAQEQAELQRSSATDAESEVNFLLPAGSVYRYGTFFPLTIEFYNPSSKSKTFYSSWITPNISPTELEPVTLGSGQSKRLSLVLSNQQLGRYISIKVNNKEYSANLLDSNQKAIVGLLAPKGESFEYLRTLKLEPDKQNLDSTSLVPLSNLSTLDPKLLPHAWPLLASLDVIIIYDLPKLELSSAQVDALLNWADSGGRLVLISNGSPNEYEQTSFKTILPLQPEGALSTGKIPQLVGRVRPQAKVHYSYQGYPLMLSIPRIQGRLYLLTAPVVNSNILTNAQLEQAWESVFTDLNLPALSYENMKPMLGNTTLKNMPELPRVSGRLIALYLLLYAIIAGPVSLTILRRKDKMLLSFLTVPIIAAIFALGAYIVNSYSRPHAPILREVGVVKLKNGEAKGYAESSALFYSPTSKVYALDCGLLNLYYPQTNFYRSSANRENSSYHITPEGGIVTKLTTGTWDIIPLASQSVISLTTPIMASLKNGILAVDSPLPSKENEAMIYSPSRLSSELFTLVKGPQTVAINPSPKATISNLSASAPLNGNSSRPSNSQEIINELNTNSGLYFPNKDKPYLVFWTDKLRSSPQFSEPVANRADYLVIVEIDQ